MNPPPSQLDVLSDAWPRRLTCSPMICQAQPHAQPRCGHPRRQRWQQLALAASPQSGAASSASQLGSVGQASTRSTSAATPPTRRTAAEHPQNTGCPPWWRGTGRRAQPAAATALPAGPAPVRPVPSWQLWTAQFAELGVIDRRKGQNVSRSHSVRGSSGVVVPLSFPSVGFVYPSAPLSRWVGPRPWARKPRNAGIDPATE